MAEPTTDALKFAAYYDSVFDRNYVAEGDFLDSCRQRHGTVSERSFIELGCGPARNARELGKRGYRAVGLDLDPGMLTYAQNEAQREGVAIELVPGDLTEFALAQPVAMAASMWDTIVYILRNEQMVSHLQAVARSLLPGGVYVIETQHPRYLLSHYDGGAYHGRVGDTEVAVSWGQPDDPYDCIEQRYRATVRMVASRNGQVVDSQELHLWQRYYQVQELRALIDLSGAFSQVHFYGRAALPLLPLSDQPECINMLAVLVKK